MGYKSGQSDVWYIKGWHWNGPARDVIDNLCGIKRMNVYMVYGTRRVLHYKKKKMENKKE